MRIFTFGCSFTNYEWPTWADILLFGNDGYNMGISGSGNESILYRIMEADRKFNFTEEDRVIVMFTTPIRWDIINGTIPRFLGYGQVTNVDEVLKYNDELYTVESLCFKSYYSMLAIKNYLENRKINHTFTSITNIYEDIDNYFKVVEISKELGGLINYVKNKVTFDLPSMYDFLNKNGYIKNRMWGVSKSWKNFNDYHPRPYQYFKYVKKYVAPKLNIDLKMTIEELSKIEYDIDIATDVKDYSNLFKEKYQIITNKKLGPEIFF